jgi:hypothetical protein
MKFLEEDTDTQKIPKVSYLIGILSSEKTCKIKYKMISVKNCVLFVPPPPTIPPQFFTTHIYITYTHTINPLTATPYNP